MRRVRVFLLSSCYFLFSSFSYGGTLVVADKGKASVHLLDAKSYTERAKVAVDEHPHEVAISPSGKTAVISHYGTKSHPGNTLSLIDVANSKLKGKVVFDKKTRPHGLAFVDENYILVTLEGSQQLALVNLTTKKVSKYYSAPGKGIHMVTVDQNKQYAYIANKKSGHVLKINLDSWEMVRKTKIGKSAAGMSLTKNDTHILVTNPKENKVFLLETKKLNTLGETKTSKNPVRIMLFDRETKVAVTAKDSGKLDIIDMNRGTNLAQHKTSAPFNKLSLIPNPINILLLDEQKALIANSYQTGSGHIALIDLDTGWIERAIFAGKEPYGIGISPVDVGDSLVAAAKRSLESKQCSTEKKGLCYDDEGYPLNSLKHAYAVIHAPKEKVWKVLTDLESFGSWNPFMVEAQSTLQVGDPISFKVILNPKTPKIKHSETLTISKREEQKSICWERRIIGAAFEAKRCFNLVELGDGRTVYYTKERFKGALAGTMSKLTGKMVLDGITREAEALKKYVEGMDV